MKNGGSPVPTESSNATPFASTWKYTVDTTPAAMIRIAIGNFGIHFLHILIISNVPSPNPRESPWKS